MKQELRKLEQEAIGELNSVRDEKDLERFRIVYLGKKGLLTAFMRRLGKLPPDQRPEMGRAANVVKARLTSEYEKAKQRVASHRERPEAVLDVTLPGRRPPRGHLHPITMTLQEVCGIFTRMGFSIVKGPNIELDYYNFDMWQSMHNQEKSRGFKATCYTVNTTNESALHLNTNVTIKRLSRKRFIFPLFIIQLNTLED